MDELQRSHDWHRLKASGVLRVDDELGVITVSGKPPFALTPPFLIGTAVAFCVSIFTFAAFHVLGWIWVLWGPALLAVLMIFNAQTQFGGMAYKIRFTPDDIEFFGLYGRHIGHIPREAMKQIAIERKQVSKEHHAFIHVFYGDAAFICALPQGGERTALLRNNLLISAFGQPVHLDHMNVVDDVFALTS